jgi:hypothetical protein
MMICKCDTKMELLEKVYNGIEIHIGNWHWCPSCGRVYYEDFDISVNNMSKWKEPRATSWIGEKLR